MRTILIDDEKKSLNVLKNIIEEYCKDVEIIAIADNVENGITLIKKHRPDLIFLDIEMKTASGFDLLERLGNFEFEVIFTTAYEQYAIKAIRYNSLDYLLKPVDVAELKSAIAKVSQKIAKKTGNEIGLSSQSKITISTSEGVYFVELKNIIRCEADGAYTNIFLLDKRKITVSKNIKEYELLLQNNHFVRIHNSHIINLYEVDKYLKSDGGQVVLKDGNILPLSINKKKSSSKKWHHLFKSNYF